MKRMTWKVVLALAPASILLAVASHAAPASGSASTLLKVPPTFDMLQDTFQRATGNVPIVATLVDYADSNIAPSTSAGAGSSGAGGEIDLEDPVDTSTSSAPPPSAKIFPVASLDAATERDVHHRTALEEKLLHDLLDYREAKASSTRSEDIIRLGTTAHVELFVGYVLYYLEGQTKEQKCIAYRRAVDHAMALGWRGAAGVVNVMVEPGWEPLATRAKAFHDGSFASKIPDTICAMRAVQRKTEVESAARATVDERIASRVETEIDATSNSLTAKQAEYGSALNASAIAVPTRAIFALKRAVEDSASLYEMVRNDSLLLERAPVPQTTPPTVPLLDRLRQKRAQLDDIRAKAGSFGELDATMQAANAKLAESATLLADLRGVIHDIAGTPGLDSTSVTNIAVCNQIPETLTADGFMSYAGALDGCMVQVGAVYSALKAGAHSDPNNALFAQRSSALSQVYIQYVKSRSARP